MTKIINSVICICSFFMFLISPSEFGCANTINDTLSQFDKEVITYDIKKFGMDVGDATIAFQGLTEIDGKKAFLIVFTAKALNFYDQENIYVHPVTLLPIIIKRDLDIFGRKEKIREEYLPDQEMIKITKNTVKKTESFSIKKKGKLENIYGFIYRYRKEGKFKVGENFLVRLPTKDVTMALKKETTLTAAGETFDAYYLESDPKQYRIWFETSDHKVPIRIDGSVGFGKTSMILKKYK